MATNDSVGKISEDGQITVDESKNSCWVNKDPTIFKECQECAFLPICMGGCNMKRFQCGKRSYCLDWKYDIPTFLEVLLLNEKNLLSQKGFDDCSEKCNIK
jgi:uncharacterized protein